jgi:hypothetical protein
VDDYHVEGLRIRDFELIRAVCVPEAIMMGVRGDVNIIDSDT